MSLFVFNNQQKLIKSIPNRDLISVVQDQAINVSDTLFVEMPADIWSNLKEPASYLAVQDPYERFSYHMYKVSKHTTKADTTDIEAIQIGYDELKAYGYIKDRRFNNRPVLEAATAIVDGTDWQLGYVDTNLPNVNTNFYYISRLEALSKLIEATGAEVRFRIEISGNKIIAKRLDLYKQLGTFKGKRFAYGSNLLEIIKEEDTSELYTALVGRGKGEETDTGGFGRRITFADIAWSKAGGDPVDKPLGQEFIELPEMTAYYGYPDGEPRTGIVEFGDIKEPEQVIKATYDRLVEISRPKAHFKAKVQTTGDMQLGEGVAIIRSDLGFLYTIRVFRVRRDYLNNMFTEVELGDKLTETLASRIKKIDTTNAQREETIIQYIQTAANGKNKIFRGPIEPTEGMMVNDLWYKPVGEGETMLYTWNGEIWELSKVSAGLLGGTLDAENGDVNLINVNVANIVGETSNFVKSWWNNATGGGVSVDGSGILTQSGELLTRISAGKVTNQSGTKSGKVDALGMEISDSANGQTTRLYSDGIEFNWYGVRRVVEQNSEGLTIRPISGSGNRLNSSLHLTTGPGAEKVAYIDFANPSSGNGGRIILDGVDIGIRHPSGGVVQIASYANDGRAGNLRAGTFQTSTYDGRGLRIVETQINTLAGNQSIYLIPSGTGELRVGGSGANPELWPIRASRFVEGSTRESKTEIQTYTGSALDTLDELEVVTFRRKEDIDRGIDYLSLGFIAEDSPSIAIYQDDKPAGVDHYKMVSLAIKGGQELNERVKALEAKI